MLFIIHYCQVRLLKQKLSKSESREKRRSLSLKGRESFAICKELEEKLLLLEKRISLLDLENTEHFKLAELQNTKTGKVALPPTLNTKEVSSCFRRKSLDSAINSEPMKILIRMNSLEAKVADASRKIVIQPSSPNENLASTPEVEEPPVISQSSFDVVNEMRNIENLLRKKLLDIYAKQKSLHEAGTLTDEAKLNIMAEKLAYESVLVCRLQELAAGYNDTDIADAERLMSELDRKLKDEQLVTKSPLEYFTKSLSQYLSQIGRTSESYMMNKKSPSRQKESTTVKILQKKSNVLTRKVENFISERIEELSTVFINETKNDLLIDENYEQNVTELVRKTVNDRLIQVEVCQIMRHCFDNYLPLCEKETSFESLMVDRANLEQWSEVVQSTTREHVETAIAMLKEKCKEKFITQKLNNGSLLSTNMSNSLQQFVDIIAHKCLLDARLQIIKEKDLVRMNENEITKLDEAAIMSEVQYLYVKIHRDLKATNGEKKLFDSLESVGTEVSVLRNSVEDLVRKRSLSDSIWDSSEKVWEQSNSICESGSSQSSWLQGVCKRCCEIKEQIINLQTCLTQSQECQKCSFLQEQLKR